MRGRSETTFGMPVSLALGEVTLVEATITEVTLEEVAAGELTGSITCFPVSCSEGDSICGISGLVEGICVGKGPFVFVLVCT